MCVCVRAHARMHACVRACVRACARMCAHLHECVCVYQNAEEPHAGPVAEDLDGVDEEEDEQGGGGQRHGHGGDANEAAIQVAKDTDAP